MQMTTPQVQLLRIRAAAAKNDRALLRLELEVMADIADTYRTQPVKARKQFRFAFWRKASSLEGAYALA